MNRNDRRIAIAATAVALVALTVLVLTGSEADVSSVAPVGGADSSVVADGRGGWRNGRQRAGGYRSRTANIVYDETHGERTATEQFPFDPNTADSTQLLRLGLPPYLVRSINRYRAHGGVFHSKEDFARLHGLTAGDYRRLAPYIHIGSDYRLAAALVPAADTIRRKVKLAEGEHVVLNTADTTKLQLVPGIGPYYASRIVQHGQRLGGYVSVDQLDEIDDFPQSAKQYFAIADPHPVLLDVNHLSVKELRRHPYINYHQAKAIDDYRRLNGPLKSLDELRLHRDFPAEAIERLRPYVTFQ